MKMYTLVVSILLALTCNAKIAPKSMKEFNKKCPTPKLCETMYENVEECKKGNKKQCNAFVNNYKKAFKFYDCQRSFDSNSSEKYIVPASWLCDNNDYFLAELSKMTFRKARVLYGSSELRSTLDGHLAEEHRTESERVGKSLSK